MGQQPFDQLGINRPERTPSVFSQASLQTALDETPGIKGLGSVNPPSPPEKKSVGWAPYAALLGGQGADLFSTLHNFDRGLVEANGIYGEGQPRAAVAATKGGIMLGMTLLMKHLAKTNPNAAKALGYIVGGAGAVPAIHNMMQGDPQHKYVDKGQ